MINILRKLINKIVYYITIIRYFLIKLLGGYTPKEYERVQQKYKALLDSKTDNGCVHVTNEYILLALQAIERYMQKVLYGEDLEKYAEKIYNVIHNNILRLVARYLYSNSSMIYKVDTTLDQKNQFMDILKTGNEVDEIEYLIDQMAGTD